MVNVFLMWNCDGNDMLLLMHGLTWFNFMKLHLFIISTDKYAVDVHGREQEKSKKKKRN